MKKSKFISKLTDDVRNITREAGILNEKLVSDLVTAVFNTTISSGMVPPRAEFMVAGNRFSDHFWEAEDTSSTTKVEATE